jgi:hypothetical protein
MLRQIDTLIGAPIDTTDAGGIGTVQDFLFDGATWTIRYLLGQAGARLDHRHIALPVETFKVPDWEGKRFHVNVSKELIANCREMDMDDVFPVEPGTNLRKYKEMPVNPLEQHEIAKMDTLSQPGMTATIVADEIEDKQMWSLKTVRNYAVNAADGPVGKVREVLVDDVFWYIRYFLVDLQDVKPGRQALIAPNMVGGINFAEPEIHLTLLRRNIKPNASFDEYDIPNTEEERLKPGSITVRGLFKWKKGDSSRSR